MVMIDAVLAMLRDRLELVLQNADPRPEKWVSITNIVNQDGSVADDAKNKVVLSVVSLQSDTSTSSYAAPSLGQDDKYPVAPPPIFVDVYLLVMAHFSGGNYQAGIGMLSRAIAFFQETPVLTPLSAPGLPGEMEKLAIEFVNLDFAQANHVLAASGLKAFPFVLYRLRRLPFAGQAPAGTAAAVRSVAPREGPFSR